MLACIRVGLCRLNFQKIFYKIFLLIFLFEIFFLDLKNKIKENKFFGKNFFEKERNSLTKSFFDCFITFLKIDSLYIAGIAIY